MNNPFNKKNNSESFSAEKNEFSVIERYLEAQKEISKLTGIKETLLNRQKEIEEDVSLAKGRLSLKPKVDMFLEELQLETHQKIVGSYEKLLTAISNDVLESQDKLGVELYTERGLPALDIFIDAGEGRREDIVNGTGGSMTNVISMGLRIIATVKSGLRKFVALDEPDCWVAPHRVPAFYNVINNLNNKLQIQAFVISHHDRKLLPDEFSIINVYKDGNDNIICENDPKGENWEDDDEGIRSIHLKNFMSHSDTLIKLQKGVNAVIGDNHIGKSVFIRALRALSYAEVSDTDIRHGEKELEVKIEIEGKKFIKLTRQRGRNPVNEWTLEDANGNILVDEVKNIEYRTGGRITPDWVEKILKIQKMDGFDHQLSHQKFPVFLLGETPSKRANVLSIGQESSYIQNMITRHKEKSKSDSTLIKNGEKELSKIIDKIRKLDGLEELIIDLDSKRDRINILKNKQSELNNIHVKIGNLEQVLKNIQNIRPKLEIFQNLKKEHNKTLPKIHQKEDIKNMGVRVQELNNRKIKAKNTIIILENLKLPETKHREVEELQDFIKHLSEVQKNIENKKIEIENCNVKIKKVTSELDQFLKENNNKCPLCNSFIEDSKNIIKGHNHA